MVHMEATHAATAQMPVAAMERQIDAPASLQHSGGHLALHATRREDGSFAFSPVAHESDAAAEPVDVALNITSASESASLQVSANLRTSVVGNVVIGEDVHPELVLPNMKGCHFYKNFVNTEKLANGSLYPFQDHNAELCPNPNKKEREEGYPDVKVSGGESGRDCHNPSRPGLEVKLVRKVITVPKLNMLVTLEGSAKAEANTECGTAEAEVEVKERINLLTLLRETPKQRAQLLKDLKKSVSGKVEASGHCAPALPPAPTTTAFAPQPGITITKQFVESIAPDGSVDSVAPANIAQDGDTVEWTSTTTNTGNDALSLAYTDVPPYGESILLSSFPANTAMDPSTGDAEWVGTELLQPGASVTLTYETLANDEPCFVNTQNTIYVTGQDAYSNTVNANAAAPVKDLDTGKDCGSIAPPTGGSGQPLPGDS